MSFPLMPFAPPTSSAGVTWEVLSTGTSDSIRQLAVSENGVWIAAGSTGKVVKTSSYGSSWSTTTMSSGQMYGMSYGKGLFVTAQDGGDNLYSSADGVTWTNRISAGRDHHGITYNDGYFVMGSGTNGGDGYVYGSADGITWVYGPQGAVGTNSTWTGIYASSSGTFGAGPSGQYKYNSAVPTSATAWTGTATGLTGTVVDVAWSPILGRAVAVSTTGIFSAATFGGWTLRSATAMNGVAWCADKFVAVGPAGAIRTSIDGITWIARTSGTSSSLYGVAEHNGVIMATGDSGVALRSS